MSTAARKAAPRIARPAARYWRGKAPKGVVDVGSESDSDEGGQEKAVEEGDVPVDDEEEDDEQELHIQHGPRSQAKAMNIALKDVDISKDGKVIVAGREESGRTMMEGANYFALFHSNVELKPIRGVRRRRR